MADFTTKAERFLSSRKLTITIVLLGIVLRLIQLVFFFNIRVDISYQVMATQNFIKGHGISSAQVLATDLSSPVYTPLTNWPPGYTILLTPFYIAFGHNYIAAALTLSILGGIALIFMTRLLLKLLDTPLHLANLYTLFSSLFVYHFYLIHSSDAITITFFMTALYFMLSFIKTGQQKTAAFTICLLACVVLKYLFIPIVFILPVFLILKGFTDKNRSIKNAGLYSFLFLAAGVGLLLLYHKSVSGSGVYISAPGRGFFPGNLRLAYPFLPASVIRPDTPGLIFTDAGALIYTIYQYIHFFILLLVWPVLLWRNHRRTVNTLTLAQDFFWLSFFISLALLLLLATLSLFVEKENYLPGAFWTYIEEARYYGLAVVLIQLCLFIWCKALRITIGVKSRYLVYFIVLLLLPEIFRGLVFSINRIRLFKKEEYSWQYEDRFQEYAAQIIKKSQKERPSEKIAVTGSSYYMNHRVSLYSDVPILNETKKINDLSSLNTKTPVLLLVILHDKDLILFQPFLTRKEKEAAGHFDGFSFYTVYVTPH